MSKLKECYSIKWDSTAQFLRIEGNQTALFELCTSTCPFYNVVSLSFQSVNAFINKCIKWTS